MLASDNAYLYREPEKHLAIAQTLDAASNLAAQKRMATLAGDRLTRIVPASRSRRAPTRMAPLARAARRARVALTVYTGGNAYVCVALAVGVATRAGTVDDRVRQRLPLSKSRVSARDRANAGPLGQSRGARLKTSGSQIPLEVTLVIARYSGEKKTASLPFTLTVITNDQRTSLRMGTDVPIPSGSA